MGWLLAAQFVTMFVTVWWTTEMSPDTLRPLVGGLGIVSRRVAGVQAGVSYFSCPRAMVECGRWRSGRLCWRRVLVDCPVVIAYLMALSLKRDAFVGHVSVTYFFTAVPMYATMLWFGRFGTTEMLISCIAMIPMLIGLRLGKRVRQYLNEVLFRRILVSCLVLLGLLLIR